MVVRANGRWQVFKGGKTFAGVVGKEVTLAIAFKASTLYTVSFTDE